MVAYESQAELERWLIGRWRSCVPNDIPGYGFEDEEAGVEFASDGRWYALSETAGGIARNGTSGTWRFEPPDLFLLGGARIQDDILTNAPWITESPRSAVIGIDPRFPRYIPLREGN